MHYEIERRTIMFGWVPVRRQFRLLTDAQLEAANIREASGVVRIVRVSREGAREVVEASGT